MFLNLVRVTLSKKCRRGFHGRRGGGVRVLMMFTRLPITENFRSLLSEQTEFNEQQQQQIYESYST
jgi:hypothetical protein